MKHFVYVFALIAFLAGSSAAVFAQRSASTDVYQIGSQKIVIPPPANFVEAASQFPSVKNAFTATEAAGNDMLAVHISIADAELLKKGESKQPDVYTKVSVSKRMRETNMTAADFTAFLKVFKQQFPVITDPNGKDIKNVLEKASKYSTEQSGAETVFSLSQPINLGEIVNLPNAFGTVLLMEIKVAAEGKETAAPLVGGMSVVRTRGKMLFVYTYRNYKNAKDIEELKSFTKNWINQIALANQSAAK